jgi:hypothetical protein
VNVINFSISGSQTSVNDPVEQAFMRAASAGVFVAASAGNSGPAQAVAHVSPWLTTVAASTHSRAFVSTATLGNGASYSGASTAPYALPQTALVRAEDAALPGADPTKVPLCYSSPAVLDPAKVSGKIVICTRGTTARVDKSLAVANAGGVGMILADNGAGLVADVHSVPTVHVNLTDGNAIKAYALATGSAATAAIAKFTQGAQPAPTMAGFSSRGPNAGDNNMLKPDLTAPGVDVIAAVTADLSPAERDQVAAGTLVPPADFASYQGTSMSSPHVAGLAALLKQAHPTWSPQAIKSALMTTATLTLNDGLAGMQNGQLPWSQGAGHVAPNSAFDPGLVYDNGPDDFTRYQCNANPGAVLPSQCASLGKLDQTYNYNLPSITVGSVPGSVTVTRRVTNVSASAATYTSSVSVPGFTAVVTPSSLTVAPGETKTYTIKFTAAGATEGQWNYGSLVWSDGTHAVKSPVTLRTGKMIAAPAELTGTTVSGTRLLTVRTGFAGRMGSFKGGWLPVSTSPTASLSPDAVSSSVFLAACRAGADTASMKVYPVSIPAGTMVARFELRQEDTNSPISDHDLQVLNPANNSAGSSGNEGSDEKVQLVNPAAGSYRVCVQAWSGPATSTHVLSSWIVERDEGMGKLTVLLPGNAVAGGTATVGVGWNGLSLGGRYMGAFTLTDPSGAPQSTTVLRVNPGGVVPDDVRLRPSSSTVQK